MSTVETDHTKAEAQVTKGLSALLSYFTSPQYTGKGRGSIG